MSPSHRRSLRCNYTHNDIVAERFSVRHIIVRCSGCLGGLISLRLCLYVYVHNGFTTEVYKFMYSLCTLQHVPLLVHLSSRYDGRLREKTTTTLTWLLTGQAEDSTVSHSCPQSPRPCFAILSDRFTCSV